MYQKELTGHTTLQAHYSPLELPNLQLPSSHHLSSYMDTKFGNHLNQMTSILKILTQKSMHLGSSHAFRRFVSRLEGSFSKHKPIKKHHMMTGSTSWSPLI